MSAIEYDGLRLMFTCCHPALDTDPQLVLTPGHTARAGRSRMVASRPRVVAPIVGAIKPHHVEDAVPHLDLDIADEEIATLDARHGPQGIRVLNGALSPVARRQVAARQDHANFIEEPTPMPTA
jgi:hypothetical protein